MEFETSTIDAFIQHPSVSDIALQLMVAALKGGQAMGVTDAYCYAEHFVAERKKREAATGWLDYPENLPPATGEYIVKVGDGVNAIETALFCGSEGIRFLASDVTAFHPMPKDM